MNERASKTVVCCVGLVAALGLSLHIFWGIGLLAQDGQWGNAMVAFAAFIGAWAYLGLHFSGLPRKGRMRMDEATPHFTRVMLPFCVPSAVTTVLLQFENLLDLSTAIVMIWGLALLVLIPAIVHACVRTRRHFAESKS
jgi:hypothetical protein